MPTTTTTTQEGECAVTPTPPDRPNRRKRLEALHYKVLVLGESSVGKTSIVRSYSGREFDNNLMYTIGIDFVNAHLSVDGIAVQLQIWDTAGQERFRTITQQYYRGTHGLLMVYDITNKRSFDLLTFWMSTLVKHNLQSIPVTLVGNKSDLADQREVTQQQGEDFAKLISACYIETSAMTRYNIEEAFQLLAHDIKDVMDPFLIDEDELMSSWSSTGSHNKPINESGGTGAGGSCSAEQSCRSGRRSSAGRTSSTGSKTGSVNKQKKRLSAILLHSSSSSGRSVSSEEAPKKSCC